VGEPGIDRATASAVLVKMLKGASVFVMGGYLTSGAGFFIRLLLARKLSIEEFGVYYATLSFLGLVGLLKNLGFNRALVKFIPEYLAENNRQAIAKAVWMNMGLSILTSGSVVVLVLVFLEEIAEHYFHYSGASKILPILLGYFLIANLNSVVASVFHGFKKPVYLTASDFAENALILLGIALIPSLDIVRVSVVTLVGSGLVLIGSLMVLCRMVDLAGAGTWFSKRIFLQMASFALPSASTTIATKSMGRVDTIMLTYFKTVADVGLYSVAAPFARLFISLGSGLGKIVFPYSSELVYRRKGRELMEVIRQIQRTLFWLTVPLALFLILAAPYILPAIYGSKFNESVMACQIIILGGVIHAISLININVINGIGYPLKVTGIVVASGIMNTAANVILIPLLSFVGAAVSTVVSYAVTFVLSNYYLRKTTGLGMEGKVFLRIGFAGGVVFVASRVLLGGYAMESGFILIPLFAFVIGFYVALSLMLGVVRVRELREMYCKGRGYVTAFSLRVGRREAVEKRPCQGD